MGFHLILYAAAAAASTILALLVYLHNPARPPNKLFALFAMAVAAWTAGVTITLHLLTGHSTAFLHLSPLFFARSTFVAASLALCFLVAFLHAFPSRSHRHAPLIVYCVGAVAAALIAISFTPLLVVQVSSGDSGLVVSHGPFYPLFAAFIIGTIAHSFYLLVQRLRTSRGIERLQTGYLLLGLLVPVILAAVTNLFVPLVSGTSRASQYGPLFSFLMVGLIAHLIIRHRFMDIRVFVRRSVAYALAVLVTAILFLLFMASTNAFTDLARRQSIAVELFSVILIALFFNRLKTWIQGSTDRYLYRRAYHYPHVLRETSSRMATLLDLPDLLAHLSEVITTVLSAEFATAYVHDGRDTFQSQPHPPSAPSPGVTSIHRYDPVILVLHQTRQLLSLEELLTTSPQSQAIPALRDLQASLALPLWADADLIAILLVGPKRSGDAYFLEDLELLTVLASQASIAIKNSQLYRQVLQANSYIENILATMESGVIAVTADGRVTLFNRAAALLANVTTDGPPRTLESLPSSLRAQLRATLADGKARINIETTLPDPTGRLRPIVSSTTALPAGDTTPLSAVVVFNDLSHLKALEAEKRRAERLASLGSLASGIAHEIKNPLVAIRTFAELLPERFADVEFRESFSQIAMREIQRIDQLVARLRDLAAPSTHNFAPLTLRHPIDETLELLRAHLEQRHLRLCCVYRDDEAIIVGDSVQLKQLFLNLLLNAVEAMDPGGVLTVSLALRDAATALPEAIVSISDTGPGISPALLGKIFDPFVTTKPRGSGLGLAICRGIADAHRANIKIENNHPALGVTVTLVFPLIPHTARLASR
jgi:signal transduction histidine kinase